jgi:tetratricopeptide (TPR) repeat protein
MRLAARLTKASDGATLWSKVYEGNVKDLPQIENDVARSVARALHVAVGANQPLNGRITTTAAHDIYMKARFLQRRRTEADLRQSVALFEQALKDDSSYAPAWAGLATSWWMLSDDVMAPKAASAHFREAVGRGLAIDPTDADLRFSQGIVAYFFDRDARAAEQYMGAALAANPDLAAATQVYPEVLWANGQRDSARAFLRGAVGRDSASVDRLSDAWTYEFQAGDAIEERAYCAKLQALHAGQRCTAMEQLDIGHADQAIDYFQRTAAEGGVRRLDSELDYVGALIAARRMADARAVVAGADSGAGTHGRYAREDDIALMHGLLGDDDAAMQWYGRALESGSAGIGAFYWRTFPNPLRKDPRAAAFAKQAGLPSPPAYWP